MNIACLGGGPGGLYFAISMKLRRPDWQVVVYERNRPDDTFGWGVVFSEQTLGNFRENDIETADEIQSHFAYWDDLAVVIREQRVVSGGHGFCGVGRKKLLMILQARAKALGVELRFSTEVDDIQSLKEKYDIVVASDGLNSKTRKLYENAFKPMIDVRACKFVWYGTQQKFDDAFTFIFEETDKGWLWAHAYQFDQDTATFIVECNQETWDAYGFEHLSQQASIEICQDIFKDHLDGHALMSNANHIRGSAWLSFPRVLCEKWCHENVVLMGDAAATAHFSIGSGTKLAMESAIALANYLDTSSDLATAFDKYEVERREQVLRLQSAALNSLEWFENIDRYLPFDPVQFNYSQLTRSQRISHENLRARDAEWLASAERWFQQQAGVPADDPVRSPMFAPFSLKGLTLNNRIVVAPIAQYHAQDGHLNHWHVSYYGERAKGGAGLIMTEMLAISEHGRPTAQCLGLYHDDHVAAWRELIDFIHENTEAKMACQIGHAGARAHADTESLIAASAVPWDEAGSVPTAMQHNDFELIVEQFSNATKRAVQCGFDLVELQFGHGNLVADLLSPLTNQRQDEYGGDITNRLRFPLQIIDAVKQQLPPTMPLAVRISAHDWAGDAGVTPADAVEFAKAFKTAGVDVIDVSSGETRARYKPAFYGRMYQTPFSDQIRNEAHIPTIAVGNIYEADHANSILLAGRADLVALGRPHLANPYWTNHAATLLGDRQQQWTQAYEYGAQQFWQLYAPKTS